MSFSIQWEAACDTGHQREKNEDAWGALPLDPSASTALLLVADGMGGHPGGEIASRLAIDACMEEARSRGAQKPPQEFLGELFRVAHEKLRQRAEKEPSLAQMGTTLTLLLLRSDGAWFGHLGDSRVLWHRGSEVALVTVDHSAAWERVVSGDLTLDEAERDPMGALLTRHLGPFAPCEPDLSSEPLVIESGDRFLLCTDGLGKVVSLGEIAKSLTGRPPGEAVQRLLGQVLEGGAPDNVTILLAEVTGRSTSKGSHHTHESLRYRSGG